MKRGPCHLLEPQVLTRSVKPRDSRPSLKPVFALELVEPVREHRQKGGDHENRKGEDK